MRSYASARRRLDRAWDDDRPATTLLRARAFLHKYPTAHLTWARYGLLLSELARHEEARQALATAMSLCSDRAVHAPLTLSMWIGFAYERAGDYPAADDWYRQAIARAPDDSDAHTYLGTLLYKSGRLADAETAFRQATRSESQSAATAWLGLGKVLRSQDHLEAAAVRIERELAADPDYADARSALRDVRAAIEVASTPISDSAADRWLHEDWPQGMPAYNVLMARAHLRRYPQNEPVQSQLGDWLTELSRHAEARDVLRTALRLREAEGKPPSWNALSKLGHSFRKTGDFPAAEDWYLQATRAAPENASAHIFLGALLAVWGRFEEAKAAHARGTTCANGCPDEAWYNLGLILRAQERFAEAAECFLHALAIEPDYAIAKTALADVRSAAGLESH